MPNNHCVDYRVVVEDALGQKRRGWVRLGSWPLGIYSKRVKVVWEESRPAQQPALSTDANPRNDPLWDDWLDH
jgi:hypothetical protein